MNKENMLLWADRLEELDPDMQTRGRLKNAETGQMCCLGVVCELAREHGVDLKVEVEYGEVGFDEEIAVLPMKVMKWLDVDRANPKADPVSSLTFAELNDYEYYTFKQIATVIRKMVEE